MTTATQSPVRTIDFPTFTAKQEEVWNYICEGEDGDITVLGWGGSVGGGKTSGLVRIALMLACMYPGINGIIGRDAQLNLKGPGSTIKQLEGILPLNGATIKKGGIVRRFDQNNYPRLEIQLPGWPEHLYSTIFFRQLSDDSFLKSTEFGFILVEEADTIHEQSWKYAISRLRQRLPDGTVPKYLAMAVFNPSISWPKEWFIDYLDEKKKDYADSGRVHFFQARQSDNPFLPENYEAILRSTYDEDEIEANVEGSFSSVRGMIFRNFSPHEHALYQDCTMKPTQEPSQGINCHGLGPHGGHWDRRDTKTIILHGQYLTIPKFVYAVGGLDFAGANDKAHLSTGTVSVIDKFGRDYLVDCFAENGPGVHIRQRDWMEHVEQALGTKVEWCADGTQSVSISYLKFDHGFDVVKNLGTNDAWRHIITFIRNRFRLDDYGKPMSYYMYTERNKKWVRQIQQYRTDLKPGPNGVMKDKAIEKDDDIFDAYRYERERLEKVLGQMFPPKAETVSERQTPKEDAIFGELQTVMIQARDKKLRERAMQMAIESRRKREGAA